MYKIKFKELLNKNLFLRKKIHENYVSRRNTISSAIKLVKKIIQLVYFCIVFYDSL